jgi:acetolactate synthase small subunit
MKLYTLPIGVDTLNLLPLHKSIADLGIPIESIVIGKSEDKSTWRIVFRKDATKEQRTQAQKMLDTWDSTEKVVTKTTEDRIAELESEISKLKEQIDTTVQKTT